MGSNSDRNKLKAGAASLLKRSQDEVQLVRRAGRPGSSVTTSTWERSRNLTTSIVMDKEQHSEIRRIANKTGNSFKQTMFLLLDEGIRSYRNGILRISGPMEDGSEN